MSFEFDPNKASVEKSQEGASVAEEKKLSREEVTEKYYKLKKQRDGILAWNDVTPDDRILLGKIEAEMEELKIQFNNAGSSSIKEKPETE